MKHDIDWELHSAFPLFTIVLQEIYVTKAFSVIIAQQLFIDSIIEIIARSY